MIGLVVAIGIYALGAFGVHWAYRRKQAGRISRTRHYVLHAWNEGGRLEWVVRALLWHGLLRDRDIRVTVIDEHSTDETPDIVRVLERSCGIRGAVSRADGGSQQPEQAPGIVCVRLDRPEDWHKLPPVCSWVM